MINLIIGNCISAVASIFLAISNCAQEQKKIYLFQLLETATLCVSSVFFASWAGLSTLLISILRNILVIRGQFQKWHVYLFSALVVVIGLYVNNRGILGLLPIAATVEITFANYYAKRVGLIKASVLINTIIWTVYSYSIWDLAAGISNTLISALGIMSLIKYLNVRGDRIQQKEANTRADYYYLERRAKIMAQQNKRAFVNGKIFTSNVEMPYAETMVVEDGIITWIGNRSDLPSDATMQVDLEGKRVLPSFVDAHMHPALLAECNKQISCLPPNIYSIAELIEKIKEVRSVQGPKKWIRGWGYDENKFKEHQGLTRYDLDQGCSDVPVALMRTCAHAYCVNSKALELANITKDTPDPPGGEDRSG